MKLMNFRIRVRISLGLLEIASISIKLSNPAQSRYMSSGRDLSLNDVSRSMTLLVSGTGEVLSPDDDVVAVGSGGSYALAAARALLKHTELSAREVVQEGLTVAAEIDIYTNDRITVEELGT